MGSPEAQAAAELIFGFFPGLGETISARDAYQGFLAALESIEDDRTRDALTAAGLAGLSALGAVPVLGKLVKLGKSATRAAAVFGQMLGRRASWSLRRGGRQGDKRTVESAPGRNRNGEGETDLGKESDPQADIQASGQLTEETLKRFSDAGREMDRNGLTRAGRASQKHGDRTNSVFPQSTGTATERNEQGQEILEKILRSSDHTVLSNKIGGRDVFDNVTGRGARFNADGGLMGFLEPIRRKDG